MEKENFHLVDQVHGQLKDQPISAKIKNLVPKSDADIQPNQYAYFILQETERDRMIADLEPNQRD